MVRLRVGEILKDKGLSVEEFAVMVGINYRTALDIAKGRYERIGLETINKICNGLDLIPADLFEYDSDKR